MRIVVNRAMCDAHGQCNLIAPELFTLDGEGFSDLESGRDVRASQEDLARRGVLACPERALRLES